MKDKKILSKNKLFVDTPIWKSLLIMLLPNIIVVFLIGAYTFVDNLFSIAFANDSYDGSKDSVRLYMASVTPITTFLIATTFLFSIGISTRFSINLGANREERAIKTIRTGNQIALLTSIVLIPILIFSAKPWIASQYDGNPVIAKSVSENGFEYIWILILAFPILIFNQILFALMRSEGRNKHVLIAMILPIFINLLLDWVFMEPVNLGIEGGAYATLISYAITTIILVFYILTFKNSHIKFSNLFGFKGFQIITIFGVLLVGVSPFMRNMSQSIVQTVDFNMMQEVSLHNYGSPTIMSLAMSAVFPIFGFFFPILFGVIQGAVPVISYNYGAKNIHRVKQGVWFVMLYSFLVGLLIYFIGSFVLVKPLAHLLGVYDSKFTVNKEFAKNYPFFGQGKEMIIHGIHYIQYDVIFHIEDKVQKMFSIIMLSAPLFGIALSGIALFNSTDRIVFNLLSSLLRGLILFLPFLYIFVAISLNMNTDIKANVSGDNSIFSSEYIFWWSNPIIAALTSIIIFILIIYTLKTIDKKHKKLDDIIENIHTWAKQKLRRKKKK